MLPFILVTPSARFQLNPPFPMKQTSLAIDILSALFKISRDKLPQMKPERTNPYHYTSKEKIASNGCLQEIAFAAVFASAGMLERMKNVFPAI
ncbi:MAG TPA: hypothetical protein PL044_10085 [Clostridiales bacterium]|nr:hypothetical protein [Clostridiales bacterium]HQH62948.1 hypothetical protein [Clostridiales bacterium]HQK74102.1 hypothetical protein [Clostridiales bacterium]